MFELCLCAKTPSAAIPRSMALGIPTEINGRPGYGGDRVKTVFGHSRGMVPMRRCVMFLCILELGLGLSNMAVYIYVFGVIFTDLSL